MKMQSYTRTPWCGSERQLNVSNITGDCKCSHFVWSLIFATDHVIISNCDGTLYTELCMDKIMVDAHNFKTSW